MNIEMLEHLQYLKDKGLYNIEIGEDSFKLIENKMALIGTKLSKDSSFKKMYHGTTLENAKSIIKDGFIKGYPNKENIEYNKIFVTNKVDIARKYSEEKGNGDCVVIAIDITKYEVYEYETYEYCIDCKKQVCKEWIIWGNIDIKDVKFTYYKNNIEVGELNPKQILQLPIDLTTKNMFFEAIWKNNTYTYFKEPWGIHGIYHAHRVILILQELVKYETLTHNEKTILAFSGLYHDIGRTNDEEDLAHGWYSYKKMIETDLINNVKNLSDEELEIMRFIMICHCMEDEVAYISLKNWDTIKDVKKAKLMFEIFKDADALDRFRLGDFDKRYLRRPNSSKVIDFARELYFSNGIWKNVLA